MEKYNGTNCTLYRVGNFVFLSINANPNVNKLWIYSTIAIVPEVPFEFHWFQFANIPISWITSGNEQSGTATCYLENKDIRTRSTITTNNNITMMNGLMVGYVGVTI